MSFPAPTSLLALAVVTALTAVPACGEGVDERGGDLNPGNNRPGAHAGVEDGEFDDRDEEAARLGLVQVTVHAAAGDGSEATPGPHEVSALVDPTLPANPSPREQVALAVQVRADFAQYRGIDEGLVRAYAGAPLPPWEELALTECTRASTPWSSSRSIGSIGEESGQRARELTFLDVGRLRLEIGQGPQALPTDEHASDYSLDVGLLLTSSLLSYASGVQYAGQLDLAPQSRLRSSAAPVTLAWAGSEDGEMPGMRLHGSLPAALALQAVWSDDFALELAWQQLPVPSARNARTLRAPRLGPLPRSDEKVIASVTPRFTDSSRGETVYCRLQDVGHAAIAAETLWTVDNGRTVAALEVALARVATYEGAPRGVGPLRVDLIHREALSLPLHGAGQ